MQIQLSRPPDYRPPYWSAYNHPHRHTRYLSHAVVREAARSQKYRCARNRVLCRTRDGTCRAHRTRAPSDGFACQCGSQSLLGGTDEALGLNPDVQEFNGRLTTKYIDADIQLTNILGVIKGTGSGKPLLLMSHYDSVPTGPGANDASVSVASLLETARAIQAGPPPQNDIWILLTDGEEGSAGAEVFFRDPHLEVGMIANFEARGSKGSSFMFQTSDSNSRIIEEYAQAVSNPVSNSLLVDLYKQLPNDTDLTVALEHGLPGLNFAYGDGWVAYHTPMDNTENVSLETMRSRRECAGRGKAFWQP